PLDRRERCPEQRCSGWRLRQCPVGCAACRPVRTEPGKALEPIQREHGPLAEDASPRIREAVVAKLELERGHVEPDHSLPQGARPISRTTEDAERGAGADVREA